MELPYLVNQKKNAGSVAAEAEMPEDHGLMAAAEDLLAAINAKDAKALAAALRAAIELCSLDNHT